MVKKKILKKKIINNYKYHIEILGLFSGTCWAETLVYMSESNGTTAQRYMKLSNWFWDIRVLLTNYIHSAKFWREIMSRPTIKTYI